MDLSTFSKFEVRGRDAYAFLERICANKIPTKDGGIVLAICSTRTASSKAKSPSRDSARSIIYLLSAAAAQLYDFDQLSWRKRPDEEVVITDVTDAFGTLVLAGPKARDVLARCTDIDLTNAAFRWLTGKEAAVAGVTACGFCASIMSANSDGNCIARWRKCPPCSRR